MKKKIKAIISLVSILIFGNILKADTRSDIRYIKQNMVTKSEFQLFIMMQDKRFEDIQKYMEERFTFIQTLLIALLAAAIGTNIYAILRDKKTKHIDLASINNIEQKQKIELMINDIGQRQEKIIQILKEEAKKDKSLMDKLKVAGLI